MSACGWPVGPTATVEYSYRRLIDFFNWENDQKKKTEERAKEQRNRQKGRQAMMQDGVVK
uniref:Uncharacterized protein n=1 Tax=Leersia perrieri TaxID=77586 RepID=A0A0D9XDW1_9ORYZ